MEPHLIEDCKHWIIPNTDWKIYGFSQAANKTGFAIFSLKIFFDAGLPSQKSPSIILLTHSHSDHSFNIPCLAMGQGNRCPVYCPVEMEQPLRLLCRASQSLNDCIELTNKEQVNTIGVQPDEIINYKKIKIKVIKCHHSVPTVGFILSTTKNSLKEEYKKLTGKEIGQLRKSGVEVSNKVEVNKLVFLGDTTITVFDNPEVLKSSVIFVECTIIDDNVSPEETFERGHIHWKQLRPIIEENPNNYFVLIHLSKRYKRDYIETFFKDINLKNFMVW